MGNEAAIAVGDWDLRGPDFETLLIGPITSLHIDADRLVRLDFRNGFPNWDMYRTALAGDALHMTRLREWVVAFSVAWCMTGGITRRTYSDELAAVAGWDALHMLVHSRELAPYTTTAERLGVHHSTYRRARDGVYKRLRASLDEYWIHLCTAARQVYLSERNAERKRGSPNRMLSLTD